MMATGRATGGEEDIGAVEALGNAESDRGRRGGGGGGRRKQITWRGGGLGRGGRGAYPPSAGG